MNHFKIGDRVKGKVRAYSEYLEDYSETANTPFSGIICSDYEDGSYLVKGFRGEDEGKFLVELYDGETMELE